MSPAPTVLALALCCWGAAVGTAGATTRLVGPTHRYAKPCQAIAAAKPGDVVQIDAKGNGTYDGDVCTTAVAHLTIAGIGGRARIAAAGRASDGKAIWVLHGAGTVVRDVELTGAKVPDRNGAAIRVEDGADLTLVGSSIHGNEDGILVGASPDTDIIVDRSEFYDNGYGDGQSHNIYVGAVKSFTLRRSVSRSAKVGHLVKSRAAVNDIFDNRLLGAGGTGSYELDLPNGGRTRVIGNVIQQGPRSENPTLLAYGEEGVTQPSTSLTVSHNTFVNDRPGNATAISVAAGVARPAVVSDNVVVGITTFVTQAAARLKANCLRANPRFVDRASYDYRLTRSSPCRGAGASARALKRR